MCLKQVFGQTCRWWGLIHLGRNYRRKLQSVYSSCLTCNLVSNTRLESPFQFPNGMHLPPWFTLNCVPEWGDSRGWTTLENNSGVSQDHLCFSGDAAAESSAHRFHAGVLIWLRGIRPTWVLMPCVQNQWLGPIWIWATKYLPLPVTLEPLAKSQTVYRILGLLMI